MSCPLPEILGFDQNLYVFRMKYVTVLAMVELDEDVRMWLEKEVDKVIKDPKRIEGFYSVILKGQGIEPNLETLLSFLTGALTGYIQAMYVAKYDREPTSEERLELVKLLKRRAFEMRTAFVSTRIEE